LISAVSTSVTEYFWGKVLLREVFAKSVKHQC